MHPDEPPAQAGPLHEGLNRALDEAEALLGRFKTNLGNLDRLAEIGAHIVECFRRNGRVFACGNGGSMADALHFAEEWTGRFKADRKPYPAIALGEATHMSCVANDYGFDFVFSRQVEALAHTGDVLVLLTTSGNSQNLVEAAKAAKASGATTVAFVGKGGGKLAGLCDLVLDVPSASSDRIQEIHMLCLHALIDVVEAELGH